MYSINSLTNSQNKSSSKAIGGLATGLDTAELIKNMTIGTRSKIAKQNQTKQLLSWQTEAYRAVSDKLVNFSRKYTSFSSSSNLLSEGFYTSSKLATTGDNASKVTVSGTSPMANQISIISATKETSGGAISTKELKIADGTIATSDTLLSDISPAIAGSTLTIGTTAIDISASTTIKSVVDAVNLKTGDTGITARYVESLGRFEFTTNKTDPVNITGDFATSLGIATTVAAKADATIKIKYGDSADEISLTSTTGSFSVDGLTININESFTTGDAVKLNSSTDTDKVFNGIKDMIKDYNDIVEHINKEYSTKRNRNFQPLSDEQRKELSEDEAKKWDEKAKAGMLSGNSDIAGLKNDLRAVFFSDKDSLAALKEIGITPSNDWKDGGKIVIDEEKLKKSIEENPENIRTIFSKPSSDTDIGGVTAKIKTVTEKYAKTEGATRGILIEKAGSLFSPLSLTKNTLLSQTQRIDKIIATLNRTLATEETRYQRQFTNLESVYAKMNSQAGWLTQQFGG